MNFKMGTTMCKLLVSILISLMTICNCVDASEVVLLKDVTVEQICKIIMDASIKGHKTVIAKSDYNIVTETNVGNNKTWRNAFGDGVVVRNTYNFVQQNNNVLFSFENSVQTKQETIPATPYTANIFISNSSPNYLKQELKKAFLNYLLMDSYNTVRLYEFVFNGGYRFGFDYTYQNGKAVVTKLTEVSPARDAGMQVGDTIVLLKDNNGFTMYGDEYSLVKHIDFCADNNDHRIIVKVSRAGKNEDVILNIVANHFDRCYKG